MNIPKIAVLVLNYNAKDITKECVYSILQSEYPNFTVFVIDNGSKDGSASEIRREFDNRVCLIENKTNLGYSAGFNKGLEEAFIKMDFSYALIMNNDIIINKEAISELVKIAEESAEKIGFVMGKVYYYDKPNIFQTVGKRSDRVRFSGSQIGMDEEDKGQYDKISEREFCDDIYWLVTKKLYKEIGGYSPIFYMESEDFEWQLRAKERGYKIFYTPYAKAWHRVSYALGRDSVKKIYYDARNPTIAIMLHASPRQFNIYLIEHLRCTIRRFLSLMKHLRFYAAVKCMQGFISGVLWGVGHKKLTLAHFI